MIELTSRISSFASNLKRTRPIPRIFTTTYVTIRPPIPAYGKKDRIIPPKKERITRSKPVATTISSRVN